MLGHTAAAFHGRGDGGIEPIEARERMRRLGRDMGA